MRPRRHTTHTTATAPAISATSRSRDSASRAAGPPGSRSWREAAEPRAAATVSRPAAVCAARSRATSRRPYQNPGRPRAVRMLSSAASGAWVSGFWDSYALQVRRDRNHSRPVSAAGTTAARARRRPGSLHQPPSDSVGERKPSQECASAHARVPAHCQAVRSRATSQAAATSRTVRVRPARRTRRPYSRTVPGRLRAVGRIQWARLTTMNGSSNSHRARVPLPEVRLHQTYASRTGAPSGSTGRSSASASSTRRKTAAVSSPVTRTVRGSLSIFSGVAPPTPWTSSSRAIPLVAPVSSGGLAAPFAPDFEARSCACSTVRTSPVARTSPVSHRRLSSGPGTMPCGTGGSPPSGLRTPLVTESPRSV